MGIQNRPDLKPAETKATFLKRATSKYGIVSTLNLEESAAATCLYLIVPL